MMRPRLVHTLVARALGGNKGALRLLARRVLPIIAARVRQWTRYRTTVDDLEVDRLVHSAWMAVLADPRLPTADSLEAVVLAVCDTHLGARMANAEERAHQIPSDPALEPLRVHLEASLDPVQLLVFRLLYTDRCSTTAVASLMETDEAQVRLWQTEIRAEAARWTAATEGG